MYLNYLLYHVLLLHFVSSPHCNLAGLFCAFLQLINTMTDMLGTWLCKNHVHPELAYWILKYIKLRGIQWLSSSTGLSANMKQVAESQDLILWIQI